MMTSKFIGHFLEEISGWQKTLCTVDTVITLWMDVQRTWSPHQRLTFNLSFLSCIIPFLGLTWSPYSLDQRT